MPPPPRFAPHNVRGVTGAPFSDRDLILRAAATINPRRGPGGRHFGGVA